MADTQSTTPRRRYDEGDLERLKGALKTAGETHKPASKTYTMQALLLEACEEIADLRRREYSVNQICDFILEAGFPAARATLRQHIGNVSSKRSKRSRTVKRKRKQPPTQESASVQPTPIAATQQCHLPLAAS